MSWRLMSARCVLLIIASCIAASAGFAAADEPVPPKDDLAAIDEFSAEIFKRLDSIAALRTRRAELERAAKLAPEALSKAELAANIAEISVVEYREGTMPQAASMLEGEIKLAQSELLRAKDRVEWSDQAAKKGSISENEKLGDRMDFQKAEIALRNAKLKMDVLQKFAHPKELIRLENAVKKAKSDAQNAKVDYERSQVDLAEIDRQIAVADLLPEERQTLERLDESIRLFDDGKLEPARAKLAEAKTKWSEGQTKRMVMKYQRIKTRIREEVKNLPK